MTCSWSRVFLALLFTCLPAPLLRGDHALPAEAPTREKAAPRFTQNLGVPTPVSGVWTWVSGPSTGGGAGDYGTIGVPAASNQPPPRRQGVSWTATNGDFWLFGGYPLNSTSPERRMNDLWKWDGSMWTWMGGSSVYNTPGSYGTKGTASAANFPGARANAVAWRDATGRFYLFGGDGFDDGVGGIVYGYMNDVWMLDPSQSPLAWMWVAGPSTRNGGGDYGGGASATPGSRYGGISWIGVSGEFWLYGGHGWITGLSGAGRLNDLWKGSWSGSTWQWTWVSGSAAYNQAGNYGTLGTASATNLPGARAYAATWSDAAGRLWVFGGMGYDKDGQSGYLSDLWRFDPSASPTPLWTWVGGPDTRNQAGVYGTKGQAAATNVPGARALSSFWKGSNDDAWLFGGYGRDKVPNGGSLNDLWRWDAALSQWIWVSGSDEGRQAGVYGTMGVGDAANVPGARYAWPMHWKDSAGRLWLFGGRLTDFSGLDMNDLWRFAECFAITMSPATLPGGRVGISYLQTLTASGGTAPYSFALSSGTLPPGLGLSGAGALQGDPTAAGTFSLVVTATDANGCTGTGSYDITILPVIPALGAAGLGLLALVIGAAGVLALWKP